MATGIIATVIIALCFGVGKYFKHATEYVDHPVEQMSEQILKQHGIEVDFSKDKKSSKK